MSDNLGVDRGRRGIMGGFDDIDSSLLFFFLLLVIIMTNCGDKGRRGLGGVDDSLLFFFLLLVIIFNCDDIFC